MDRLNSEIRAYEIRRVEPFTMLGVTGGLDEIGVLWDRFGKHFADGTLTSADPALMATAAEFTRDGGVVYAAGAPCEPTHAGLEGFERVDVPGGRYALVQHRGSYGELASIPGPLRTALEAAGERLTDRWLELYYPPANGDLGQAMADGSTYVEIGVLLAED